MELSTEPLTADLTVSSVESEDCMEEESDVMHVLEAEETECRNKMSILEEKTGMSF